MPHLVSRFRAKPGVMLNGCHCILPMTIFYMIQILILDHRPIHHCLSAWWERVRGWNHDGLPTWEDGRRSWHSASRRLHWEHGHWTKWSKRHKTGKSMKIKIDSHNCTQELNFYLANPFAVHGQQRHHQPLIWRGPTVRQHPGGTWSLYFLHHENTGA